MTQPEHLDALETHLRNTLNMVAKNQKNTSETGTSRQKFIANFEKKLLTLKIIIAQNSGGFSKIAVLEEKYIHDFHQQFLALEEEFDRYQCNALNIEELEKTWEDRTFKMTQLIQSVKAKQIHASEKYLEPYQQNLTRLERDLRRLEADIDALQTESIEHKFHERQKQTNSREEGHKRLISLFQEIKKCCQILAVTDASLLSKSFKSMNAVANRMAKDFNGTLGKQKEAYLPRFEKLSLLLPPPSNTSEEAGPSTADDYLSVPGTPTLEKSDFEVITYRPS